MCFDAVRVAPQSGPDLEGQTCRDKNGGVAFVCVRACEWYACAEWGSPPCGWMTEYSPCWVCVCVCVRVCGMRSLSGAHLPAAG